MVPSFCIDLKTKQQLLLLLKRSITLAKNKDGQLSLSQSSDGSHSKSVSQTLKYPSQHVRSGKHSRMVRYNYNLIADLIFLIFSSFGLLYFDSYDENLSWYIKLNSTYCLMLLQCDSLFSLILHIPSNQLSILMLFHYFRFCLNMQRNRTPNEERKQNVTSFFKRFVNFHTGFVQINCVF